MRIRFSLVRLLLSSLVVFGASLAGIAGSPRPAVAQNISGVINTYANVLATDACKNEVTIPSTAGFAVGDTILLLQMTGCAIDVTNTSYFGKPGSLEAGIGEFNVIAALPNPTTLRFLNRIHWPPSPLGACQVIRVPQYTDVVVSGTLTAKPWDGITGGVLIFMVSGTVTLNADIDVSGLGFRGGRASLNGGGISVQSFFCDGLTGLAGFKGEGVATKQIPTGAEAGRGAPANGGGGGNAHNSGGGGGSFSGFGGQGGDQTNTPPFTRDNTGGRGGWQDIGGHAILGGGGGGGHQNDGQGSGGANGGGMVMIFAKQIASNGRAIRSQGLDAKSSKADGAGGGGAGGPIYLLAGSVLPAVEVSADGGAGGDADADGRDFGFGPGGGGGAGIIYTTCPVKQWHARGGASGRLRNCTDLTINDSTYGASAGMPGDTLAGGSPFRFWPIPFQLPDCPLHSTSMCPGNSVQISASGGDSYTWAPGGLTSDTIAVSPAATTVYTVQITKGACVFTDTVHVEVLAKPIATFTGSLSPCNDGSAQPYSASPDLNTTYLWTVSGGRAARLDSSTINIVWDTVGTDTLILKAVRGTCESIDTALVTVGTQVTPLIAGSDTICAGSSTHLGTTDKYASYLWHPTNETTDSITVNTAGSYWVDVISAGGCKGTSAPISIVVHPKPALAITSTLDTLAAIGDSIGLTVAGSYPHYLWSTKDSTQSITITDSGMYYVTVMDSNGCTALDSIYIPLAAPQPDMTLGLTTIEAYAGDHVVVPVNIVSSHNVNALAATTFTYTLTFNKSLLAPSDPAVAATSVFAGPWRTVTVSGNRDGSGVLSEVGFTAALGDSLTTPIFIDKIGWSNGRSITTSYDTGKFVLLGVCTAGGNRLFSENGNVILSSIRPNPVRNEGTVDYSLAEPGQTELFVLDMLGRKVATLSSGDAKPGTYRAAFDASHLPNGIYRIVLQTPTQMFLSKMEVFH